MARKLPKLRISRREKRLIGVAILAVVLFFSYDYMADFLYYRPLRIREQIFHERNKLERSELKIQAQSKLKGRLATTRREMDRIKRRLLPGDKPPIAAARLQRIIEEIARQTNVNITSQKIDKPIEHPSVLEVPVEVVFRCNVGELKNFLYRIESHQKLLNIPKWTIRVPNHRNPKEIQVNMTIAGFIKKAGA